MLYKVFKSLHIICVVLLLGNVIVTGLWKILADRTRAAPTVACAQQLVILTDWIFTGGGIALILIGGYAMAGSAHLSLLHTRWLLWGQALFGLSAVIWVFILLPVQAAQSRMAQRFAANGEIPRVSVHPLNKEMIATAGIVKPMLASAEPSVRLRLVARCRSQPWRSCRPLHRK